MSHHDSTPLEERFFLFEQQEVTVHDFESLGYILDIGGGGEGIIGILKGEKVIAIDLWKRELEEAADGPLKLIMDARDLQFLDSTFNTVTAFFTLMYLKSKPDYEEPSSVWQQLQNTCGSLLIFRERDVKHIHDAITEDIGLVGLANPDHIAAKEDLEASCSWHLTRCGPT